MIHVSRKTPPADHAAKATAIVTSGRAVGFRGDARHLRRVAALLDGTPGVTTFLGDDGLGAVYLMIEPSDSTQGCLYSDRVG